jgi:hypothetical protein
MHPKRIGIRELKSSHSKRMEKARLRAEKRRKRKRFLQTRQAVTKWVLEYGQEMVGKAKFIPNVTEKPIKRLYIGSSGKEKAKLVDERPSGRVSAASMRMELKSR